MGLTIRKMLLEKEDEATRKRLESEAREASSADPCNPDIAAETAALYATSHVHLLERVRREAAEAAEERADLRLQLQAITERMANEGEMTPIRTAYDDWVRECINK